MKSPFVSVFYFIGIVFIFNGFFSLVTPLSSQEIRFENAYCLGNLIRKTTGTGPTTYYKPPYERHIASTSEVIYFEKFDCGAHYAKDEVCIARYDKEVIRQYEEIITIVYDLRGNRIGRTIQRKVKLRGVYIC